MFESKKLDALNGSQYNERALYVEYAKSEVGNLNRYYANKAHF